MPNGKRLKIDYCPITKQPVGPYASKLANYLGTHAWNGIQLPLTYADWRYLPTQKKDDVWQQVQSKFEVDPCLRNWVDKSLGKKWKDFKSDLKVAHYYTHESREERIKDCDIRVEKDQWEFLMDFWDSQKGMERSTTNKGNRALQRTTHTSGSKSFARVWKKERAKRTDGKEPSRAHIYILTHSKKNGQPMDAPTADIFVPGDIANAPMTFPNIGVRLASHPTTSHEIRQTKRRKGN